MIRDAAYRRRFRASAMPPILSRRERAMRHISQKASLRSFSTVICFFITSLLSIDTRFDILPAAPSSPAFYDD